MDVLPSICVRCGYDLRSTTDDQPCPECGLLAIRSRPPTEHLADTSPGWLATVNWGLWLVLLTGPGLIVGGITLGLLSDAWGPKLPDYLVLLPLDIAALLIVVAAWLVTWPDPVRLSERNRSGRAMRILSISLPALSVIFHSLFERYFSNRVTIIVLAWGTFVIVAVIVALLAAQMRWLSQRVNDVTQARRCTTLLWGWLIWTPGLLLALAIEQILPLLPLNPRQRDNATLYMLTIWFGVQAFLVLGGYVTVVRMILTTAHARRIARSRWHADDLSRRPDMMARP